MTYPIDEDRFVNISMKEIGEHDEVDEKVARAVVATLNWVNYKWGDVNRKVTDTMKP